MIEKQVLRPSWADRREPRNEAEKKQLLLSIPAFVEYLDRSGLSYEQWKRRQRSKRIPLELMAAYQRLIEVA